jgi:hypothetical protein
LAGGLTTRSASRWMNCWNLARNAFAITFEGRLFPTDQWQPSSSVHRGWDGPRLDGPRSRARRSTITTLGTPADVTLQENRIEPFHPNDS